MSYIPAVNSQEVADLISSGMTMGSGAAIMAGGAGIGVLGAIETGSIATGNPVGWTGPHTMAEGGMMMVAGGFFVREGWGQFKEYWDKYYQPPEGNDPCENNENTRPKVIPHPIPTRPSRSTDVIPYSIPTIPKR